MWFLILLHFLGIVLIEQSSKYITVKILCFVFKFRTRINILPNINVFIQIIMPYSKMISWWGRVGNLVTNEGPSLCEKFIALSNFGGVIVTENDC
jgi:hypothetical protein